MKKLIITSGKGSALVLAALCSSVFMVSCLNPSRIKGDGALNDHGKYVNGELHVVIEDAGTFPISGIYSLDYIIDRIKSKRVQEGQAPDLEELLKEPYLPTQVQVTQIEDVYEEGDVLLYISVGRHGWALMREGKIIEVWVRDKYFL